VSELAFKTIAYQDCLQGGSPFDLFVVVYSGSLSFEEQRSIAIAALPVADVNLHDFGFEVGSLGLLILVKGAGDSEEAAERVWSCASGFGSAYVAVTRIEGNAESRGLLWERALTAEEVLRHPRNEVEFGVLDVRSQRVRPVVEKRSFAEAQDYASLLLRDGLAMDAGFVLFEAFRSSEARISWLQRIAAVCQTAVPIPEVEHLMAVMADSTRWNEAHRVFQSLRSLGLSSTAGSPREWVLSLAELLAKVTYNESVSIGPFDRDTGWWIVSTAAAAGDAIGGAVGDLFHQAIFSAD
jgi:hypothetical protein